MSDYLPSFIVDPVLRQARRLSRLSSGEESPGFLPTVPDLQRWNPTRLWATSPPPSADEDDENKETAVQSIAQAIQLWTNQINNLDLDPLPSPPLESMNAIPLPQTQIIQDEPHLPDFPPLETPMPDPNPPARPVQLEEHRTDSETSLNPAQELPYRSRTVERVRGQPSPDPSIARPAADDYHPRRRDGSDTLPEDDGMGPLRQRIVAIWDGPGTAADKSRLVHLIMSERYRISQKSSQPTQTTKSVRSLERTESPGSVFSGASQEVVFNLTDSDYKLTYAPLDPDEQQEGEADGEQRRQLGCIHYIRNVKMQCATCERWYPCRLCHDDAEDHILPRRDTKHMLCMLCKTPQQASQICKMCGEQAGCYYCAICKLWNNDPSRSIYHCDDCGICRLGEGLGKDYFHCKRCAACMSIQAESTHKCIERSTKCDCPICGEYMFTSNRPVAFMRCGHSIHETCFAEWCNTSYKCPICSKSIANMESQFRRLDRHIEGQPMPEEYRNSRAYIFCNDCNCRSVTSFHWLGLRCALCESYNTTQLELLDSATTPEVEPEQAREYDGGETSITASQSHTPTQELTSPAPGSRSMSLANINIQRSPSVASPWLLPNSPTRSVRSVSPLIGSYFGTGPRVQAPRRVATPMADDDELDFWGRRSPPNHDLATNRQGLGSSSGEDSDSGDEAALVDRNHDDEEEEEDAMAIFGHR